jgi:hypothetical protein
MEDADEAVVTHWFFDDDSEVMSGDLVGEIMVQKAVLEVRAPISGRLKILQPVDSIVRSGTRLAEIT